MSYRAGSVTDASRGIARASPFVGKRAYYINYMYPDGTFCLNRRRQTSPLADIQHGWRPVGPQRARKLRKRGETVEWRPELHSMAWLPGGR